MSSGPGTSYSNVHHRIRKLRGPASDYLCWDCRRPAHHWSYTGGDPLELTGRTFAGGRWRRVVYSLWIGWCYVPRCRSCHRRHDIAARKALA